MRSFWIYVLIAIGAALVVHSSTTLADERIPFARFRELADQGQLADVEIRSDAYVAHGKPDAQTGRVLVFRTGRIDEVEKDLLARLDEKGVPYTRVSDNRAWLPLALWLLPLLAGAVIFAVIGRKAAAGGMANPAMAFTKNKARLYDAKGPPVTFADVAGSAEPKEELAEIVQFLKAPDRFRKLGGRVPRGVLLVGPPGTGKTLLARAVAGEAGVPFFSICGSEFVELFVGVGAARVRDLFAQAREKGSAIIFIDELDALGKSRSGTASMGGSDEREQALNQLLTEMDGFEQHATIIVLAATNRPEILDAALLRAGRFDRRVVVDRPDLAERKEILALYGKKIVLGPSVDLGPVAESTPGLAGADLSNLTNEAALLAARRGGEWVEQKDFEEAIERGLTGLERRGRRLGPREKLLVAYHETGHALTAELLPTQDPVGKISIIPRGMGALGFTMQRPREDRFLFSRQEILDRLVVILGGRVAEEITMGDVSTGAQDDLVNATDLARRMVRELGMSSLGVMTLGTQRPMAFLGGGAGGDQGGGTYSDATVRAVDGEVAKILADALERGRALLLGQRELLERVAKRLYEKETLTGDELRTIVRASAIVAA